MMKWFWAPILVVALSSAAQADDAYVIGKGDVVEIDVLNLPVLHRRLTVGPDGKIAMPVLGALVADGLTLDQLQDALRKQLIEKNVVRDPNVAIAIAEYRPVFVNGDVGKPGDYAYRADLTVRKAIAVAGGYGPLVESRGLAPLMETARAKGDIGSLAIEVAKQRLKVLRLTAELADQPELSVARPPDASVDPELFGNLAKTEVAQFETICQVPFTRIHFCTPAVACAYGVATFPFTAGVTSIPSPSSQTYRVFRLANQMPNGYRTGVTAPVVGSAPAARVLGKPGRIVIGTFARVREISRRENALSADLIDSVDAVTAAALGDVQGVV